MYTFSGATAISMELDGWSLGDGVDSSNLSCFSFFGDFVDFGIGFFLEVVVAATDSCSLCVVFNGIVV